MASSRYIFTKAWIMGSATVCILRPTGTLKPGIIMFVLTPFVLVADMLRHRFSKLLNQKPGAGVQPRNNSPSS
jgi:hypothetical protein